MIKLFFVLPALLVVGFIFLKFLSGFMTAGAKRTRNYATENKLFRVTDVMRDVPTYDRHDQSGKSEQMERFRIVCYSLPVKKGGPGWSLLQRANGKDTWFGGRWVLNVYGGKVSDGLEQALRNFTGQFNEEFFEIECKGDGELRLFWEEWGGERLVKDLFEKMDAIKKAQESASPEGVSDV